MSTEKNKLLVIQVAGLGSNVVAEHGSDQFGDLKFRSTQSVFPAVTCSAQAAFRTGLSPDEAGMPGNGFYDRRLGKVMFWEQSASLVSGERIWDSFRQSGKTVAMLFWQQSLGEQADFILSPAPIHKHHGGMIQDCYSKPAGLYTQISKEIGRGFNLKDYWGPIASPKSSQWIAEATCRVMKMNNAPDLCMTYLPALDYDFQRHGIKNERSKEAVKSLSEQLDLLKKTAEANDYEVVVFGDYAIVDTTGGAVFPNRVLCKSEHLVTRKINGMRYPDFHESLAFAVVDHEIAHIYVKNKSDREGVSAILKGLNGVDSVTEASGDENSAGGDLIAVASDGCWFAYPWWAGSKEAPEYAAHVDIHSKPGYDPCELFFGKVPWKVSVDTDKVKGSHGKIGQGREVCWASTLWDEDVEDILALSSKVRKWLDNERD